MGTRETLTLSISSESYQLLDTAVKEIFRQRFIKISKSQLIDQLIKLYLKKHIHEWYGVTLNEGE